MGIKRKERKAIMIKITLNDTQAITKINQLAQKLQDRRQLYGIFGETLMTQHKNRFDAQTSPDGKKWQATKSWYKSGGKILHQRGYLRNTLRYQIKSDHIEFGSNRPYAAIHHFGGVIKPKRKRLLKLGSNAEFGFAKQVKIPARPWLGVSNKDGNVLLKKTENYLRKVMQE